MPVTDTPLRYPGGKSQLIPFVIDLMRENDLFYGEYAEPFAGGAGIAMKLLLDGYVDKIYINDFDPSIYAFWHSVLHESDDLCNMIEQTDISIEQWHKQREKYYSNNNISLIEKGFATLFLNRTNRSGIIKAGVIGGLQQNGNYKLDCRFIKPEIIRKIKRISCYRDQINLTQLDAIDFVTSIIPKTSLTTLVNLDPPYFKRGPGLYCNFYKPDDHASLALSVSDISRYWIVTYDDEPEIRRLYEQYPMYSSKLNYSAQIKRIGTELLVADPRLRMPDALDITNLQIKEPQAA